MFVFCILQIDSYDEAVIYAERRRLLKPPVYNAARIYEQPIPNIAPPNNDIFVRNAAEVDASSSHQNDANESSTSNNEQSNENMIDYEVGGTSPSSSQHNDAIECNASNNELLVPFINTITHVDVEASTSTNAETVEDPPNDPLAYMKNEHGQLDAVHNENIADVVQELVQDADVVEELVQGEGLVQVRNVQFDRIDDDIFIERIGKDEEVPLPVMQVYQLKKKDLLTGNTPFIEHVSINLNFILKRI